MIALREPIIPTTPFLKWLGGKRWAPKIVEQYWRLHQHRRMVDLTLGSGAIPLALQPERFLGCDINAQLIQLWEWVRDDGQFTLPLIGSKAWFTECRDRYNLAVKEGIDDPELPQLLYLLCRTCFNGVHRSSRIKAFNVHWNKKPFGGQTDLTHYREAIGHWQFQATGYEQAIAQLNQDDFVIFDPPYDSEDGKGFVGYHGKFTRADQVKAAEGLAKAGVPVVAFNAATSFVRELYQDLGFSVEEVLVPRSVSCNGAGRQPVKELIFTKNMEQVSEQTNVQENPSRTRYAPQGLAAISRRKSIGFNTEGASVTHLSRQREEGVGDSETAPSSNGDVGALPLKRRDVVCGKEESAIEELRQRDTIPDLTSEEEQLLEIVDQSERGQVKAWLLNPATKVSPEWQSYLRGSLYNLLKKRPGGSGANQHRKDKAASGSVIQKFAEKHGVSTRTLLRDARFADYLDLLVEELGSEVKTMVLTDGVLARRDVEKLGADCLVDASRVREEFELVKAGQQDIVERIKEKDIQPEDLSHWLGSVAIIGGYGKDSQGRSLKKYVGQWCPVLEVRQYHVVISLGGEDRLVEPKFLEEAPQQFQDGLRLLHGRIAVLEQCELDEADSAVLGVLRRNFSPTARQMLLLERMERDYGIGVDSCKEVLVGCV